MLGCGSRTAEEEERAFSRVGGRTDMETGEGPGRELFQEIPSF
jgi:hypothetical protein